MNPDGWITIGTKLDTKDLEKELSKAQRELQKFNKESERLMSSKAKVELDLQEYERQTQLIKESTDETLKKAQTEEQVNSVLQMEEAELQQLKDQYSQQFEKLSDINKKIDDNTTKQEQTKQKIIEINSELNKTQGFNSIKDSISSIGKSLEGVTKKVVRWGLAIFGVRSAYMFIRQSMSTLSQYNEQLAVDLQYIRFALASTLQPVIEYIVKLVIKLFQYLGYILKQLFGINIFKNSGIDKFQSGIKKSADSAKELKKQLAGFDEMEVLQDNTNNGGGDAGGGIAPSIDFSKMENFKAPKWLDKIVKFGKWVLKNWEEVVFTLLLVKLFFDVLTGNWIGVALDFIGLLIIGFKSIWENLKDIINIIKPYWREFINWLLRNVVEPIGKIFNGLWNGIKDTLKTLINNIKTIFGTLWDIVTSGTRNAVNNIKNFFSSIPNFFSGVVDKVGSFLNNMVKAFNDGINIIKNVINEIPNIIKRIFDPNTYLGIWNNFKRAWDNFINGLTKNINVNYSSSGGGSGSWGGGSGGGGYRAKGGIYYPKLASGGIINMPGRGVPYHGATIAERGAEAVVPLTDSQQMALLGEAIGKYITVNATIVNSMNGRVLNRELQKIQNQTNFATNGR